MRKTMLAMATGVALAGGMAANGPARADEGMWLPMQLPDIAQRVVSAQIFPEPKFSDHAPCLVEYRE